MATSVELQSALLRKGQTAEWCVLDRKLFVKARQTNIHARDNEAWLDRLSPDLRKGIAPCGNADCEHWLRRGDRVLVVTNPRGHRHQAVYCSVECERRGNLEDTARVRAAYRRTSPREK